MKGKKFPWGKVMDRFEYNFDGEVFEVTKYQPKKYDGSKEFEDAVSYHCEEIHESSESLYYLLISWIAYKKLGLNQHSLTEGICRALKIIE